MKTASMWLICGAVAFAGGVWTASAQTPSTPGEATFVAEVHWGELVAHDASYRSAGMTHPRKADGPERELPLPRGIEVLPDGSVRITPLERLEELEAGAAAGAVVDEDFTQSFAAEGASPRMLPNGLTNLDTQDTFEALLDNNAVVPPDTMGAIGAQHIFTMLNSQVRVQSRDGSVVSTVTLGTFWAPVASSGIFDPRVFYDDLSNRFVAVALRGAFSGASAVLVAVSASSDPTGVWRFFSVDTDAANVEFADFPDAGYNNRWVAVTANMFSIAAGSFQGAKMWVFEKDSLYAPAGGVPVHIFPTAFEVDPGSGVFGFSIRTVHTHDATEDALHIVDHSGFVRVSNGQPLMRISRVTGPTNAPVWSVMPGSPFGAALGLFDYPVKFNPNTIAAAQAGSVSLLDTIGTRMLDAEFRNGSIWTANGGGLPGFTAGGSPTTPNRTASVWTQIDATNTTSTPFIQGGLIAGGVDEHFFVPSIAVNRANDVLVGFTHSSPNVFPRAGYSGRLGTDLLGGTRAPVFFKAGEGAYDKPLGAGVDRWGDYSQTSVDPKDDRTFWTIQEYAETPAPQFSRWGTQWARVGFVSCPPDIDGDGMIGPGDLLAMLSSFGLFFGPDDLLELLAAFGANCPTQTP